ncbi:hypothetical protein LR68_03138 [Anoxybacillus sp. BCO1]|nr:hypothetical protein LR68_03138 [Anoxybacillus sp. BCO1]
MMNVPKTIMLLGVVLIIVGFLMQFIKLGRLPGDIVIKKENATFLFSDYDVNHFKRRFIAYFLYDWSFSLIK